LIKIVELIQLYLGNIIEKIQDILKPAETKEKD